MCSLDSQTSPTSKNFNCAPIHSALNTSRTGQSLISCPRHGYCDVFFSAKCFWKALGSGQSGVRLGITMTTWCVLNMNVHHYNIRSSHWLIPITPHAQSGLSAFRKIYVL